VPSLHVTSRSTSLSGVLARATDPINRTSVAPCLPAMRRIAPRFFFRGLCRRQSGPPRLGSFWKYTARARPQILPNFANRVF